MSLRIVQPNVEWRRQERAILGTLFTKPSLWDQVSALRPSDFAHPPERLAFEAFEQAHKSGAPFDLIAISGYMAALDQAKVLPNGAAHFANELENAGELPEAVPWHIEQVLERARSLQLRSELAHASKLTGGEAERATISAVENYQARVSNNEGFPTLLASEVPDPGPTRWLIENLWISGGCGLFGGAPKSKKSLLTLSAAVAVASGGKLLSRYQALQAPVLVFNAEDRIDETASRLRRMCVAQGIRFKDLPIHMINITGMRLNKPDDMRKLSATVRRIKPGLVVLDPFRNLFDGDEDNSTAVSAGLLPLRELQREYNCAVMLVHHMTKPNDIKRRDGEMLRGSGALHGWGDCNLYVKLKGDVSAVTVEQRYAAACEPFGWRVHDQSTPDGMALWCEPAAIPANTEASEGTQAAQATSVESSILLLLARAPKAMTGEQIRDALRLKRERCVAAIQSLFQQDQIRHVEVQIKDSHGRERSIQAWEKT